MKNNKENDKHRLLVCTLGGSPGPIVASIGYWKPDFIIFIVSPQSKKKIEDVKNNVKEEFNREITPNDYELLSVMDADSYDECAKTIHLEVEREIKKWQNKVKDCEIIVDFTGGTKCMSATLAIVSQRWRCMSSYVGGTERDRGGLGTVIKGKEKVLSFSNPFDSWGFINVDRFVFYFDNLAFSSASKEAEDARDKVSDKDMKNLFNALHTLAQAYSAWDRFQHEKARRGLYTLADYESCLSNYFHDKKDKIIGGIRANREFLGSLVGEKEKPSLNFLKDLLANALRRKEEKSFDDAVARLYRFTEALAQLRLKEGYGINSTKNIPLAKLPLKLQKLLENKSENGFVTLGLQQAYLLLCELGDEVGRKFDQMGWLNPALKGDTSGDKNSSLSPLEARNSSILAHGFDPVTDKTFDSLWKGVVELAKVSGIDINTLPQFIKLGD
jgi:CRISPR-associated protein (TIGR02710 family)